MIGFQKFKPKPKYRCIKPKPNIFYVASQFEADLYGPGFKLTQTNKKVSCGNLYENLDILLKLYIQFCINYLITLLV